jgi:sugar phosphate permease
MAKESLPAEVIGTAFGALNSVAPFYAAFIQWVFGAIIDNRVASGVSIQHSYSTAFIVILVSALLSLVAVYFMVDTYTYAKRHTNIEQARS